MNAITSHAIRQSKKAWFSANGFVKLHDGKERRLNIDELKIIAGLPADYEVTGNKYEQWERVARCVPPPVMREIGNAIVTKILGQHDVVQGFIKGYEEWVSREEPGSSTN